MKRLPRTLVAALLVMGRLAVAEPSLSVPITYTARVVGISDGDTIRVLHVEGGRKTEVRVRLHGIDCPESGQPFGTAAKKATSARVFEKTVKVVVVDTDRYGRSVAEVLYDEDKSLNRELVQEGMAWWYRAFAPEDHELERLEREAREGRVGLWKDKEPTPPWEWRRSPAPRDRSVSSSAPPP